MYLRFLIIGILTVISPALCGQANKALNMVDKGDFMEIPYAEEFLSEQFTLEMWIKRHPAIDNTISTYPIFSGRGVDITLGGNRFPQQISVALEGDNGAHLFSDKWFWPDHWYHIAVAHDGSVVRLFIDGVLEDSVISTWTFPFYGTDLHVGEWINEYFYGEIDEIRYWNTGRTRAEIQRTMHTMEIENMTGLVGYWKFDDADSLTVPDHSGNQFTAAFRGRAGAIESNTPVDPFHINIPNDLKLRIDSGQVRLGWEPVSSPKLAAYRIYRGQDYDFEISPENLVASLSPEDTLYKEELDVGASYFYRIAAVDDAGNLGAPSIPMLAFNNSPGDSILLLTTYYLWNTNEGRTWEKGYRRKYLDPPQSPMLGEYDVSDTLVIRQHIKWSEKYGIDVWMMAWEGIGSYGDMIMKNTILDALAESNVRFCIQYNVSELLGTVGDMIDLSGGNLDLAKQHFNYLADQYFSHENYFAHGGKQVVFLRSSRIITSNLKSGLEQLRSIADSAGFDLFLIGDEIQYRDLITNSEHPADRIGEFDAVATYSVHRDDNHTQANHNDNMVKLGNTFGYFRELGQLQGTGIIPTVMPGFNNRGSKPSHTSGITPPYTSVYIAESVNTLENQIATAMPFVDEKLGMLMVTSFNGFHEDTQIEPERATFLTEMDSSDTQSYSGGFSYRGRGTELLSLLRNSVKPGPPERVEFDKDVHIAAYYYQWYGMGWGFHWRPGPSFTGQTLDIPFSPLLGEYNSDDPQVVRQHVEWSEQSGIDSWVLAYPGFPSLSEPTDTIAKVLQGTKVSFSFLHGFGIPAYPGCEDPQVLEWVLPQIDEVAKYFSNPNYWKIDGKPVLIFYAATPYAACTATFEAIRSHVKSNYGYELYLFGDVFGDVPPQDKGPWDGYTVYSSAPTYYGYPSTERFPLGQMNFPNLWDFWDYYWGTFSEVTHKRGLGFLPAVSPAFNDQAVNRHPVEEAGVLPMQSEPGASYTSTFEYGLDLVSSHLHEEKPMFIITSWNEWHEGTQIEPSTITEVTARDTSESGTFFTLNIPHRGYGFDYLNVLQERFGPEETTDTRDINTPGGPFESLNIFPNPFTKSVKISFTLTHSSPVRITIYNYLGQEVSRLLDHSLDAGNYQFQWIPVDLNPGIYMLNLRSGESSITNKIIYSGGVIP